MMSVPIPQIDPDEIEWRRRAEAERAKYQDVAAAEVASERSGADGSNNNNDSYARQRNRILREQSAEPVPMPPKALVNRRAEAWVQVPQMRLEDAVRAYQYEDWEDDVDNSGEALYMFDAPPEVFSSGRKRRHEETCFANPPLSREQTGGGGGGQTLHPQTWSTTGMDTDTPNARGKEERAAQPAWTATNIGETQQQMEATTGFHINGVVNVSDNWTSTSSDDRSSAGHHPLETFSEIVNNSVGSAYYCDMD